jgi:hypothetical protein
VYEPSAGAFCGGGGGGGAFEADELLFLDLRIILNNPSSVKNFTPSSFAF